MDIAQVRCAWGAHGSAGDRISEVGDDPIEPRLGVCAAIQHAAFGVVGAVADVFQPRACEEHSANSAAGSSPSEGESGQPELKATGDLREQAEQSGNILAYGQSKANIGAGHRW
ncbi:MAG: hypothetical protein OEZ06_22040 [Myxococcales bacterium]|nr:hypothetical protein [Myxococcales bacterium]